MRHMETEQSASFPSTLVQSMVCRAGFCNILYVIVIQCMHLTLTNDSGWDFVLGNDVYRSHCQLNTVSLSGVSICTEINEVTEENKDMAFSLSTKVTKMFPKHSAGALWWFHFIAGCVCRLTEQVLITLCKLLFHIKPQKLKHDKKVF